MSCNVLVLGASAQTRLFCLHHFSGLSFVVSNRAGALDYHGGLQLRGRSKIGTNLKARKNNKLGWNCIDIKVDVRFFLAISRDIVCFSRSFLVCVLTV